MKALIAACVLATPAAAFEPMTLNDCRNGWIAATDAFTVALRMDSDRVAGALRDRALRIEHAVTADGWCRQKRDTRGLEDADFETFDWQAEGLDAFVKDGAPPTALRVRLTDVVNDEQTRPPFDVAVTMRQMPDAGLFIVEDFRIDDDEGDWLIATAVFNGAYFGTAASAQSSFGGITLASAEARLNLTPARLAANGAKSEDYLGDFDQVVVDTLDGLNDAQLDADSRAALMALLADLPDATGALDVGLQSANGLGWMQLVMAQTFNADATTAEMIGFALSGVDVDVAWTPVE